jgi:adenylate cyclase
MKNLNLEIERRFLVSQENYVVMWANGILTEETSKATLRQGYLRDHDPTVRVRLEVSDREAYIGELTIKGAGTLSRSEHNFSIPLHAASLILEQLGPRVLTKIRRRLEVDLPGRWTLDNFLHPRSGMLVEAEFDSIDQANDCPKPPWVGREVTDDPRYTSAAILRDGWPKDEE